MSAEIIADRLARYVCGLMFSDLSRDHVSRMKVFFSLTNRTVVLRYGGMIFSEERDRVASRRFLPSPEPAVRNLSMKMRHPQQKFSVAPAHSERPRVC